MSDVAASKPGLWTSLANPTRFMALSASALPWLWATAAILTIGGLAWAWNAPQDYQQGVTVRIMYIHVPAAWLAMFAYAVMTASALGTLIWRHPLADVSIRAAAPIGAAFTLICLLTSVFVLMLMYLGIIALQRAMDDPARAARPVAILVLVGSINIPIIKFSVDIWNTLHQPASVIRLDGPTIHPAMLWPLLVTAIGTMVLFAAMHMLAMRNEIRRRRAAALRRAGARGPSVAPATAVLEG